jgi:hypothetical protein
MARASDEALNIWPMVYEVEITPTFLPHTCKQVWISSPIDVQSGLEGPSFLTTKKPDAHPLMTVLTG